MYARRCEFIVWSSICMLDGVSSLFGSVYVCWTVCVHCLVEYMYARRCEFIVWFSICMLDGVSSLFGPVYVC